MAFPFGAATPPRTAISCRLGGRLARTRLTYYVTRRDQRRRSKGPKSQAEVES